jgi:hypothetical protein
MVYCKWWNEYKISTIFNFHKAVRRSGRKAPHIPKFDSRCV